MFYLIFRMRGGVHYMTIETDVPWTMVMLYISLLLRNRKRGNCNWRMTKGSGSIENILYQEHRKYIISGAKLISQSERFSIYHLLSVIC